MSEPAFYSYRTFAIEGQQVKLPAELDPAQDLPARAPHSLESRQFRQERRALWIKWQQLGLPMPDPDNGRVNLSSVHLHERFSPRPQCVEKRLPTAAAAD